MTDKDTITLPREVVKFVLQHLEWWSDDEPQEKEAIDALRTALAAPPVTHPGYVIGSHWLETAYSRVCAGEAEADVLRDCGWERVDEALRRDAEQGRWLREWLDNNGLLVRAIRGESLAGYEHPDIEALRRDAERYRYLRNRDPKEVFNKSGKAAGVWIDWEDDLSGLQLLTGDDADAAIDAAMGDKT